MGNPNRVRNESIPASVFSALPFSSLCQGKAQHRVCHLRRSGVWRHSMPESEERKDPDPSRRQTCFGGNDFYRCSLGVVCMHAHRYGVLTGRYSWRTKLQSGVVQGFAPCLIVKDRPTVASFLKQQGYHTAIIGKWHLDFKYLDPKSGKEYSRKNHKTPPWEPRFPMVPSTGASIIFGASITRETWRP